MTGSARHLRGRSFLWEPVLACALLFSGPALAGEGGGHPASVFVQLRVAVDESGTPALPGGVPLVAAVGSSVPPVVVGIRSGRLRVGLGLQMAGVAYTGELGDWAFQGDLFLVPTANYTLHVFAGGRGAFYLEAAGGMDLAWGSLAGHLAAGARLRLMPGLSAGVEGGLAAVDSSIDGNPGLVTGVYGAATVTFSLPLGPS